MDAFSYLSVLLSIVIGLGMTQVLTAAGRLIRHRDQVRGDWLPLLWAFVMLVIYVQVWWAMFGLRAQREWNFPGFLLVLGQTATLYMMAAVVLPENADSGVDLRTHYERQNRWFFGFFLATLIISVAKDVVVGGQLPGPANLGFHGLMATACLLALAVPRRRIHEVIGIACAIAIAGYIGLLFGRLR